MSGSTRTHDPVEAPATPRWALSAAGVSLAVLLLGLALSGAGTSTEVIGLAAPGGLTQWGLPIAKLLMDASATVTVGFLLLAVLLPPDKGELGREALQSLRIAAVSALVWAASAAAVHLLTLSDLLGVPIWGALKGSAFQSFTTSVAQGRALAVVVILALMLAVSARLTLGYGGAVAVLLLGIGTLVPPGLTGHSSTGDYHNSAAVSLLVHVVGVALWVGGLVAVSWYAAGRGRALARVAPAYSAIALACFVAVAASGVINAWLRLGSPLDLLTTPYGGVLTFKIVGISVLFWYGLRNRRRTLRSVVAGRPGAFRRLAAGEIAVMGATIALAVVLSRLPPPAPNVVQAATHARDLLGFAAPPEPTLWRFVTEFYPDGFFGLACLAAVLLYGAGLLRLRRRGDRWPIGRTISWFVGVALVAFVTLSGLMTYGMLMLSVHMTQHMLLSMVAPVFLVLGGPITLALRAIRPAPRGQRGAREVLLAVVHSAPVRFLTHPVLVWVLFVSATFGTYFTPLFEFAMRNHTAHIAMHVHFLLVGYLFAEVIMGIDPLPKRPAYPLRIFMVFAAMAFHAFFGVAFMSSANLIAGSWYRELAADVAWLPNPLDDQQIAGGIAWGFGEIPTLLMVGVVFVQWYRSDEREARRKERAGTSEAELKAYNAYLSRMSGPGGDDR